MKIYVKGNVLTSCYDDENNNEELIIPDGITSINYGAVFNCQYLRKIFIPAGVEDINNISFLDCPCLEYIEVDKKNKIYFDADGILYKRNTRYNRIDLVKVPDTRTSVTLPLNAAANVASFSFCFNLEEFIFVNPENHKKLKLNFRLEFNGNFVKNNFLIDIYNLIGCSDFSLKLPYNIKYQAIVKMFLCKWFARDDLNKNTEEYIRKNLVKFMKFFIENNDTELIKSLIDSGFVNSRNIGKYISYADERENFEIFDMLTEYKENF
ncbi:MAG: leucine-rich repeat protein [Ruminococcus sp.]|nr:leucine-rich repeat protein [Ruminococcus sp.]